MHDEKYNPRDENGANNRAILHTLPPSTRTHARTPRTHARTHQRPSPGKIVIFVNFPSKCRINFILTLTVAETRLALLACSSRAAGAAPTTAERKVRAMAIVI
jgi:hypothetical protein